MQTALLDYEFDEIEEIREVHKYSDPVSSNKVSEIEDKIRKEIKDIREENIKDKCIVINKLLRKRNVILKEYK